MTVNFKDWQKNLQEETQKELTLESFTLEELEDYMMSEDFEQLDELKKSTLSSYIDKARNDIEDKTDMWTSVPHGATPELKKRADKAFHQTKQREKGMELAKGKLSTAKVRATEELTGNQHKLDVDKDGEIESSDLKKLRSKKSDIVVNNGQQVKENEGCGKKMYREFVEEIEEIVAEAKKNDYWDFKDLKDEPKPTSRKVAGRAYGGAAQKDEPEDDDNNDKPAVKRGRGRPAGSKSGARTAGNGKSYGGLAIHSLNLPSKR